MRLRKSVGFAIFCLLAGSRWMVENASPSALPILIEQSLHYALVGMIALALSLMRRRPGEYTIHSGLRLSAASLLICVPAAMIDAAHVVSSVTAVALFALVPVVIVLSLASSSSSSPGRALMAPALIGMAGTLLLLGVQPPVTIHAGLRFAVVLAAVLLTSGGCIWMHTLLQYRCVPHAVAILCGADAVVLGIVALLRDPVQLPVRSLPLELLRCLTLDLPQLFLFVWLLRELPPARFASRYLLVPLIVVLEEAIFLRPRFDLTMGTGILLMAAGGGALLLLKDVDEARKTSYLNLN